MTIAVVGLKIDVANWMTASVSSIKDGVSWKTKGVEWKKITIVSGNN